MPSRALPAIQNGSFTEAAGPTGAAAWSEPSVDRGELSVVRDTADFASAPASLRLEAAGGPVSGSVSQRLEDLAPGAFLVRGKVRSSGDVDLASVAVSLRDASYEQLAWVELSRWSGGRAWRSFERRVEVPEGAADGLLMILLQGRGTLWVDDLEVVEVDRRDAELASVLFRAEDGFDYDFGALDATGGSQSGVRLSGSTARGGAGIHEKLDLSGLGARVPEIRLRPGATNRTSSLTLQILADDAKHVFRYDLPRDAGTEEVEVTPREGATLQDPSRVEGSGTFDPAAITSVQVLGDWTKDPVDLTIREIRLVEPGPEVLAEQAERTRRRAEEAEAHRLAVEAALANPQRGEDAPRVVAVRPVGADLLEVEIHAGRTIRQPQQPYIKQPGDELRPDENPTLRRLDGRVVVAAENVRLMRKNDKGELRSAGYVVGDQDVLWPEVDFEGLLLEPLTVDLPAAYRLMGIGNAAAEGVEPEEVHRKSRPVAPNLETAERVETEHRIALRLPAPLEAGQTVRIGFPGLNTAQQEVTYTHAPRVERSPAIHVSQIGYRPDDPHKRAYLSHWTGDGGGVAFDAVERFELLDERNDETVFRGEVRMGVAQDTAESLQGDRNHSLTDVFHLDFSDFRTPGTYRVHVPGLGCSFPFEIRHEAWMDALRVAMRGLLAHRSGIALGPPLLPYERPRPMHPDDGFDVYQLGVTTLEGEAKAVLEDLQRQLGDGLDTGRLTVAPEAWGGHMDAGDWDRNRNHLKTAYLLLEAVELHPEFFTRISLALPEDEASDALPDVANEALWTVDLFRRLQTSEGGVRGGIESAAHPRHGEASWQETLLVGVFAPDHVSSYHFAAVAAKAARVLAVADPALAAAHREAAERAFAWAEANEARVAAEVAARGGGNNVEALRDTFRSLAAVELYNLTEAPRYHQAFRDTSTLAGHPGNALEQHDAAFAYARLPASLADPALADAARAQILEAAERAIAFAEGNAFGLTTDIPSLPVMGWLGYFSTPGILSEVCVRAHALTGEERFLAATIRSCDFAAGANPMNRTLTTGLGHRSPRWPLHMDSHHTGHAPPPGITVYGPSDPQLAGGAFDWAHTWRLAGVMHPDSRAWPTSEFYVDIFGWPPMNEYTIHQTFHRVAYTWGYLAARERSGEAEEPS
ncbi:glycoside hydrolase family 9 protein [Phycisphaera mikurensis]|uniref:Putative glycoside hydrolase n=1 Tax=Phycisphaera mikurensis (strain NBRC 102666 / KCTC 22515 / FYK2301M01) TaxID=1142394 RepID=I0ID58_PHYMF|nr:glycoside hydrolase family 9 protein [Phycisphaera mikurensis]MBB6442320.1 endoglucanase [Phycisphaera mikurensis]BAM03196.1 putative glycoside hydrolase [Phycisphaera mikurensis NBRC 102666]